MKKEIHNIVIASTLILGLFAGPAFAQTSGSTQPQQQMGGSMQNGMMGQGMMGQGMMGGNWGMMGQGMMGGNQGNWGGMGCNGMMGGTMMNQMTPRQQQEFMNQTTDLRKEMINLSYTYNEALRNSVGPKELAKIEKQMLELRMKMMDKMQSLQAQ